MPYPREEQRTTPTQPARPKPRPRPAPVSYSAPPPPPPVVHNSGGQYSGGGGAPRQAPNQNRQGNIQGVGRQGAIQRRQGGGFQAEKGKGGGGQNPGGGDPAQNGLKQFLAGDETYQSAIDSLLTDWQNYKVSNKGERRQLREDFGLSQERMGQERLDALEQMKNDFAARGLLNSSEYMDAIGKYDTEYTQKLGDLTRDRDRNLADLLESLGLYKQNNKEERANARAEAVRRRAQQMGLTG